MTATGGKPTLHPCPKRWQKKDGTDGGPCPAYLDDLDGNAVCVDHGIVGNFVADLKLDDKAFIKAIPKRPQRQDALDDQLKDLALVANRLGMYDAADFIDRKLDR